jgi:hypothetical protein
MKVYYLPLEPYQERYTLQLKDWTEKAFKNNNIEFETIEPFGLGDNAIIQNTGPLDYWRRTRWALLQTEMLINKLSKIETSHEDVIYAQDMFHPGIEALFYIYSQQPVSKRPRIYLQNCAQSMDIYDFTFPMIGWMRDFEKMCDGFITGHFVASTIHKELMQISEFQGRIHVTGLPFDKEECIERLNNYGHEVCAWEDKENRVIFSSRFDDEKQPHFFMDLVERWHSDPSNPKVEFAILQGGIFNSTDQSAVDRARNLESQGLLVIHEKLEKEQYYKLLNESKIQINTALQDFVSNTLNEASAFGTKSLLPAFRSFPEAVDNNPACMYLPWSMEDCMRKLKEQLVSPQYEGINYPAAYNSMTLQRVCNVFKAEK